MKSKTDHSKSNSEKIRKRAHEIWKRKCQSFNTALDDWLQAEREFRSQVASPGKSFDRYTQEDVRKIKERAQVLRNEKIESLRTTFDDWIQAEKEIETELKNKIHAKNLFDMWFSLVSPRVASLLDEDVAVRPNAVYNILETEYVKLMTQCMT